MSCSGIMKIPEGYQLFEYVDPFEDLVGPLCFKETGTGDLIFAFEAGPRHANTSGKIHGGMLMTFADFALCLTAIHGLPGERCVTVSLNCEFTAPGEVGDFIQSTAKVVRRTRSLAFVRGEIMAEKRILLNYSAIVKRLPRTNAQRRDKLS
ncbi:MAG: thioesterase [Acidobacteria bacterium]|nr:thioesterase [Acidobacteriota bacterium]|tara:strand:- start:1486 stop:1938 length:453 start_codon:yes stop_codon:yes gene_type:complete